MKSTGEIAALILDELSVEDGCGLKLRWLHDQIAQAILDEREGCAKVLDDEADKLETGSTPGLHLVPRGYAQKIRNRTSNPR